MVEARNFSFPYLSRLKLGHTQVSFKMATGFMYRSGRSQGMIVTTHVHLAVRLRVRRLLHEMFCRNLYLMSSQYNHNLSVFSGLVSSFLPVAFPKFSAEHTNHSNFTNTAHCFNLVSHPKETLNSPAGLYTSWKPRFSLKTLDERLASFLTTFHSATE